MSVANGTISLQDFAWGSVVASRVASSWEEMTRSVEPTGEISTRDDGLDRRFVAANDAKRPGRDNRRDSPLRPTPTVVVLARPPGLPPKESTGTEVRV